MDSAVDWPQLLADQLEFHWSRLARPRLDGLTDREYFGEPVADCWSLRPRRDADGHPLDELVMDGNASEPEPPPFTTICWRLAHIIRVLGVRTHRFLGGPDPDDIALAATAADALAQLDGAYLRWHQGVSTLPAARLAEPCGPDERYFEGQPLAALILHVNREVLCHCAEVALLRDLYARVQPPAPDFAKS